MKTLFYAFVSAITLMVGLAFVQSAEAQSYLQAAACYLSGSNTKCLKTIDVPSGGTGAATLASNGVLYGSGTSAVAAATAGTADQVLVTPHAGGAPVMGKVDVSQNAAVTGALRSVNGGTGGDFSGATGVIAVVSGAFSSITIDTAWTTYTPTIAQCTNGAGAGSVTSARYIHINPKMVRFEVIVVCTGNTGLFSISIPVTADYAGASQVLVGNVSSSYAGASVGYLPFIVSGDMTHVYVTNTSATQVRLNANQFTSTTSIVTLFFDVAI